jgi:hypothetical protein
MSSAARVPLPHTGSRPGAVARWLGTWPECALSRLISMSISPLKLFVSIPYRLDAERHGSGRGLPHDKVDGRKRLPHHVWVGDKPRAQIAASDVLAPSGWLSERRVRRHLGAAHA